MKTKWDHFPIPDDWPDEDAKALQRLREFFQMQIAERGSQAKVARFFGWKIGASIEQACDGRQKVGPASLKKLHDKGFSAVSIYPENTYAQELSSGKAAKLPCLKLRSKSALDELKSGRMGSTGEMPVSVIVSQGELPAGSFLVEALDDELKGVGGARGVLKGDLVVCDPSYKGVRGSRPVVVETDAGMDLVAKERNGQQVIAVAVLVTMEAVPLL